MWGGRRHGWKKYTVGGIPGVTWIWNKNVQINFISFVLFDVALNGTHVEDVEDYRNICIVVSWINVEDVKDI